MIYHHDIENADATPPHLKFFPAFGELILDAWFFAVLCVRVAQFYFLKVGLIVDTFDHMWVTLVTLFRICELNVA